MAIGAFISISVATRGLEVAALANRLSNHGWRLITAVMVLFSLLGTTMGFSVETLGFYALFVPLMAALGHDRLVTAAMIIVGSAIGVMAATVNPFSIGVAAGEAGVGIGEGILLRLILWVLLTAMAVAWVLLLAGYPWRRMPCSTQARSTRMSWTDERKRRSPSQRAIVDQPAPIARPSAGDRVEKSN